jgi:hypothetical protein
MGAKNYHALLPRAPRTTVHPKAKPDIGKTGKSREENRDERQVKQEEMDRHSRLEMMRVLVSGQWQGVSLHSNQWHSVVNVNAPSVRKSLVCGCHSSWLRR